MKSIIKAFIQNHFYGNMIIFLLLIVGLGAYFSLKKSTFPLEESKTISVSVVYPGASPSEMEESVTSLVENAIRGIPGIKETSSVSREGSSLLTITVKKNEKTEQVLTEVKNAVDGISNFPGAADRPIVNWKKASVPAMFMSLYGNEDLLDLKQVADEIEDDFLNSGIISQVSIQGIPGLEISVDIKEDQLRRYNLNFDDLTAAIASNNLDIAGGIIRNPREEINILSRMRSVNPEHIKQIVIRSDESAGLVRIGDVAEVHFRFQESANGSWLDGKPQVSFMINKLNNEDLDDIRDFIDGYIADFNTSHDSMRIVKTFDFSDLIDSRLNILTKNGLLGILLVVLFLSLFLNFRLSLWVAWGIPASFLGMFVMAFLMGLTVNMISLFGMIMVIGILVDDGIVIGENIYAHYEKGKSPPKAALDGTLEVLPSIITSVSTTILAFVPLMFLQGHMSMMFEMAAVVIGSLAMSVLEGMFVLPGHLSRPGVLEEKNKTNVIYRMRKGIEKGLFRFRDRVYVPALKYLIRYKWAALFIPLFLVFITAGMLLGGKIGLTFFPSVEDDYFTIDLALKPGTSQSTTKAKLMEIEQICLEANEEITEKYQENTDAIRYIWLSTGSAFSGQENGTHTGSIAILLKDMEDSKWSVSELKNLISEKVGDIPEAEKFAVGASARFGAPVSISLLSRDDKKLKEASVFLEEALSELPSLFNIMDNNQLGNQEIRITPKAEAYALGLNQSKIMHQVQQAFFGGQAQRLVSGKNEIRVYVRYPREDRSMIGQLNQMKITTATGEYPLISLADLSYGRSPVTINRYNGMREIKVEAFMRNPTEPVNPVIQEINEKILPELMVLFPEVEYKYRGQVQDSNEEGVELMRAYLVAFILIVIVLMIHFKSFYQGVLILLVIPLGWMPAIWGHGIEGYAFSLLSAFGMIALSGTIINDAVVFLSRYNQNLLGGLKVVDAVIEAAKSRFRPILLTSFTTVAGLYPLILETSMQARFLVPMAISLAYGIFIGTIFILLFFPILILSANSIKMQFGKLMGRKDITAESIEPALAIHQEIEKMNI